MACKTYIRKWLKHIDKDDLSYRFNKLNNRFNLFQIEVLNVLSKTFAWVHIQIEYTLDLRRVI